VLALELTKCASENDSTSNLAPIRQLLVLHSLRLYLFIDRLFGLEKDLQSRVDDLLDLGVLKVGSAPVEEKQVKVPNLFKDYLERDSADQFTTLPIFLQLLIMYVDLLPDTSVGDVEQQYRVVANEGVHEDTVVVPHLDVQVLLHQLEVACLK